MQTYGGTPAGWYPDPYYAGGLRYWDGTTWTQHAQAGVPGRGPLDIEGGTKAARRAGTGFVLQAVVQGGALLLYPFVLGTFADSFREAIRNDSTTVDPPHLPPAAALLNLASPLTITAFVLILIWAYKATVNARALGRSTRHSPAWAVCGWIVPVVNLWFPYQIVRDLLPEGHPDRGRVGLWWGLYLSTSLGIVPVFFVSIFGSTALALAIAVVPICLALGGAVLGRRIATAVAVEQATAAAALGRP